MQQELKNDLTDKMNKAMLILEKELSGLRTGRASPHFLDSVVVEVYGSKMPISQVGTVSTPDAKTISVQVWDKSMVKVIEKAIADSNLGLNPSSDGQVIRMSLPPLSEERRKEIVKIAHKYGENTKIALRNIRRDGMEALKKMEKDGSISEDEHRKFVDETQKLTDVYSDKVDSRIRTKEKEILSV